MRNTISVSRGLIWAIAAVLAVATTPATYAVSDSAAARSKLSSDLPPGVSLGKASISQTAGAIRLAVVKDPGMATSILTSAILAKTPKQGHGELSCENLEKLTRAAVASDAADASKLVDVASSLRPDCADTLSNLLTGNNNAGVFATADEYGFGVGFGPGFPGSPGFVGSPPSGSVALPAASPTQMTSAAPE